LMVRIGGSAKSTSGASTRTLTAGASIEIRNPREHQATIQPTATPRLSQRQTPKEEIVLGERSGLLAPLWLNDSSAQWSRDAWAAF
jgi:hypothetical protein